MPFAAYDPAPQNRPAPVPVTLAEATPDDVPTLAKLQARARGGTPHEWAPRIERTRTRNPGLMLKAKAPDATVGYAGAAFLPEHPEDAAPAGYYLTGTTVDPTWRRRGIGTLLTRRLLHWAWERQAPAWCFISSKNRASLALHRNLGFEQVRCGPSFQGIEFTDGEGWLLRADPRK